MTFANPELLFLLILLVPAVVWYIWKNKSSEASLQISSINGFKTSNSSFKYYMRHALFAFRIIAMALLIMALARPQSTENWKDETTEGIDIVMALDISSSMLARDFDPNRLEASKSIAREFIQDRSNDRIGLVVFSGESFTQCPLTTDHNVLLNLFEDIESGMVEDGTAIGMGLATALNRLKDSDTESKVVILLTDGVNNMGSISPFTASEIAKSFDIRVYTIGVGSQGKAPYPVNTPYGVRYKDMKVEIDEEVLGQIAAETEGEYFRATDNQKLKNIYQQIDEMEKSRIEVKEYSERSEEYLGFALIAGILLLIEIVSKSTLIKSIP
ncbi:MAG: vWA domain-containing protein [Bacteroidales bacterium]